jgi:Skp family chaperone for outer membrane proteins
MKGAKKSASIRVDEMQRNNEVLERIEKNFKRYEDIINTLSEELKSKDKMSPTSDTVQWEEALKAITDRVGDLEKSVIKLIKYAHHHDEK